MYGMRDHNDWRDYRQQRDDARHGGMYETAIKVAFGILLAVGLIVSLASMNRDPQVYLSMDEQDRIVNQAHSVFTTFLTKVEQDNWTIAEAVDTRNKLVDFRNEISTGRTDKNKQIQNWINVTVERPREKLQRAATIAATDGRLRAMHRVNELHFAYQNNPPSSNSLGGPVDLMVLLGILFTLGLILLSIYIFFMPFALACMVVRMRKHSYSIKEELIFGWRNLLLSSALWPMGLGEYPRDTAQAMRRKKVELEFRARLGKGWSDVLSALEIRQLNDLVLAPKAELNERLEAISELPARALWQARFALAASMIVGILLSPFGVARAQSKKNEDAAKQQDPSAQIADKPDPISVKGYLQADSQLTDEQSVKVRMARLVVDASPVPALSANLQLDMESTPTLSIIAGTYRLWDSPVKLTFGKFL